ncbi:CCA tRNA nucleotidyltransferase, mitochondrial [Pseudogymnoascus verrucosus]|uniref:CCA tRNA nucleotidyltransferase, mitochondrial n=1 Tax=Pseudogymnoascus verrucosus TaxID=342668 RepID=A0A1B8GBH1_9PEZI|nr:CCA tRNA nucleotidyltransferase, mitochondrial [Pseudogymnoascus verrucosus]OBT93199.1 CCA tRNA nucleotidyltransferase, mitochondrial [Pseudogymnoascus verrucosus]
MASASIGQANLRPEDVVATARITLTPQESKLRNLLLDVARYIDESKEIKERLELRFAGGWVRDKLLAIPSNDIDTAINSMTGYAFSLKMKEYLDVPENRLKHGIENVSSLHKIAANPEKSKHLETVTTKLLGYDLDFVNLRKETYTVDSRNPQMEFGTAREDALRRDATINALFYNIHTDEVEDFAGGLADLDARLIRTPLEPHQTFVDDPLRVLRLIRFASRLNFRIDTDSELSMGDPAILDALKLKISRERVGVELEKMMNDKNTRTAFDLIDRLGLYTTIFTNPTAERFPQVDTSNWKNAYNCLDLIKSNESPASIYKLLVRSDESEAVAWVLAALSPWALLGSPPRPPGGKLPLPYATFAAREGIKSNNKVCDVVTGASRHFREIIDLKAAVLAKESHVYERDTIGMTIRRWDANGGQWKLHVVLAILVESMGTDVTAGYDTFLQQWQKFLDHIIDLDLLEAATCKRIIDGKQLSKELKAKPGIWMTAALDLVMAWQFRNPTETDPRGAIEEVLRKKEELKIPII